MYQPGLKGVTAVETTLSHIDGKNGMLLYRGLPIQQFVNDHTFEETAFYLLHGTFPTEENIAIFQSDLIANRDLPMYMKYIIDNLPAEQSMMDVLRTAISSITNGVSNIDNAVQLIAIFPTIIAYRYRKLRDLTEIKPDAKRNHVENFMYMLTGNVNKNHVHLLEAYLIMTMEHGLNASTFAARVTISTQSDLISAVTSAIGTMKGPLHGGAPSGVIDLLGEISSENHISETIHKKLKNKERIMGFGHRVYKTIDPRAEALKEKILTLDNVPNWVELALKTEKETIEILKSYKPGQKLYTNVEYYAAAIMKSINLDSELFTAIFSSSRIIGWCAHAIEQANNNTIFRPSANYIGK
ncbi:citrate/2-methylcitrate synthase [Lentibacillus sp. Marseille-P4043]|uniref:citrate/2-methylcitrate synthase n=1 Tax=Lentibacillus sp. Marseille-P4043 TaxID=2040293 RepID=UPI000D0B5FAE|nr:citrate/2-methylcitrate synthase [Lentibacillus sp. Marseille-P4043]